MLVVNVLIRYGRNKDAVSVRGSRFNRLFGIDVVGLVRKEVEVRRGRRRVMVG